MKRIIAHKRKRVAGVVSARMSQQTFFECVQNPVQVSAAVALSKGRLYSTGLFRCCGTRRRADLLLVMLAIFDQRFVDRNHLRDGCYSKCDPTVVNHRYSKIG